MLKLGAALAAMALVVSAGTATAAQQCGATVHSRYGETRAYFQNVLGACRPDGYCSAVVALPDPTGRTAWLQQLRVARPTPGADHQVELAATTPFPSDTGQPMIFTFLGQSVDLTRIQTPTSPGANEYRVSEGIAAKSIVSGLRRQRVARWTYQSDAGPAEVYFSLMGMTAALNWIDCMGAR